MTKEKETDAKGRSQATGDEDVSNTAAWFERVKALVAEGRTVSFTARGYSMWPALRPDSDNVYLGAAEDLKRGDIVLARCESPAIVVLHRIKELNDGGLVLMGDANLYQTEVCEIDAVAGKVTAVTGKNGSRSGKMRRGLSRAVQKMPPWMRRVAVRILNKFK